MSYTIAEVRDLLLPLALNCGYTDVRITNDISKYGHSYWAMAHTTSGTAVTLASGFKIDTTELLLETAWDALYGKPINAEPTPITL